MVRGMLVRQLRCCFRWGARRGGGHKRREPLRRVHWAVGADPLSALTGEQRTRFQVATGKFATADYAGALPGLRELLKKLPAGAPATVRSTRRT